MKAYTDIEQSKELAEILPFESADMCYDLGYDDVKASINCENFTAYYTADEYPEFKDRFIPAWSLAALINILPASLFDNGYFLEISKMGDASKPNEVRYYRFREDRGGADFGRITRIAYSAENLIDACVNMILHLKERGLI